MNKSELALLILQYEQKAREAENLLSEIEKGVLELGETFKVGDVTATYYNPSDVLDWETPGKQAPKDTISLYTTYKPTTAWKQVCLEAGIEPLVVETKPARVVVKIK